MIITANPDRVRASTGSRHARIDAPNIAWAYNPTKACCPTETSTALPANRFRNEAKTIIVRMTNRTCINPRAGSAGKAKPSAIKASVSTAATPEAGMRVRTL